jgi:hypothetical protein
MQEKNAREIYNIGDKIRHNPNSVNPSPRTQEPKLLGLKVQGSGFAVQG